MYQPLGQNPAEAINKFTFPLTYFTFTLVINSDILLFRTSFSLQNALIIVGFAICSTNWIINLYAGNIAFAFY